MDAWTCAGCGFRSEAEKGREPKSAHLATNCRRPLRLVKGACPSCMGVGAVNRVPCARCGGSGRRGGGK